MATFKPAYLIHGDDHGRIAERRARLRTLAEAQSGASGVELFEGESATPAAVANAMNAMTFALGRRFIVVDGVERWKEKDLEPLEAALAAIGQAGTDTTLALFGREDSRLKVPQRLADAVRKAGGDVSAEQSVKPWELPKWVIARGRELGIQLDADGARRLITQVGDRQQRLLRELEKLALATGAESGAESGAGRSGRAPVSIDASTIEELTAPSAERRAWSLADALVARDAEAATRTYLTLRAQGERVSGLLYWMAQRVRLAHEVAQALEAGQSEAQIKRKLRMPSRAAARLVADAREAGAQKLRQAIERIADLELASRGGSSGVASEDTEALRAIREIAA